jgi:hypothetical protein
MLGLIDRRKGSNPRADLRIPQTVLSQQTSFDNRVRMHGERTSGKNGRA